VVRQNQISFEEYLGRQPLLHFAAERNLSGLFVGKPLKGEEARLSVEQEPSLKVQSWIVAESWLNQVKWPSRQAKEAVGISIQPTGTRVKPPAADSVAAMKKQQTALSQARIVQQYLQRTKLRIG
jgi:hypothetical protein